MRAAWARCSSRAIPISTDPDLDRAVAVKVLKAGGTHLRLLQEARAQAKLAHPNVVGVYEVGEASGGPYIAMEYIEGETLSAWLARGQPWTEVVAAFRGAGRGLLAAHEHGLVHRDFKPANFSSELTAASPSPTLVSHTPSRPRAGSFLAPSPRLASPLEPRPTWRPSNFAASPRHRLSTSSPLASACSKASIGYSFESASIPTAIAAELDGKHGALPLLQFAARRLWSQADRERRLITAESFRQLGEVAGLLAEHAGSVLVAMGPDDRVLAREVLVRLASPQVDVLRNRREPALWRDDLVRSSVEEARDVGLEAHAVDGYLDIGLFDDHFEFGELRSQELLL